MTLRAGRTTVVLGAGASYCATKQQEISCPVVHRVVTAAAGAGLLDRGYADEADKRVKADLEASGADLTRLDAIGLTLPVPGQHLAVLKNFIMEQFGVREEELGTSIIDFESLMGLVEADVLGWHSMYRRRNEIPARPTQGDMLEEQTYLVLCGALVHTTAGVQCPLHRGVVDLAGRGATFISFNYDLLIDRVLASTKRWFPDDGYCLPLYRIGRRAGDEVRWRPARDTSSEFKLLKLHGSVNWLHCRTSAEALLQARLHGARPPRCEKLYCLEDMNSRFAEDHPLYEWWERFDHEEGDQVFGLFSLIVPPTTSKPYRDLEHHLGNLWADAFETLVARTTDLVVIGYSLRPEDLRSRWLFRKASGESGRLRTVHVVDPDPRVLDRAREIFLGQEVRQAGDSIEDFLARG